MICQGIASNMSKQEKEWQMEMCYQSLSSPSSMLAIDKTKSIVAFILY